MAIPFIYNIRSVKVRWTSTLVAVFSIAGVVAVFVAVLAMARGFQKTLISSGSSSNAIIMRGGATTEMESILDLDQIRIISDFEDIMRDESGASLISPEVVVVAAFPLKSTGTDANIQVRGLSDNVLKIRTNIRISEGRFFTPGLNELVIGINAVKQYGGFSLNQKIEFSSTHWEIVGIIDSGGTAFDSEIWCDAAMLNQAYKRPTNIYQSATARLSSTDRFIPFKDALTSDPRLTVSVEREIDYYAKQSEMLTMLIKALGFLVASVMAVGAIFGAINTMYSAVSARSVEIATLRALGFRARHIITSFVLESMFIALLGGLLGIILIIPINGTAASTLNWQTFSQVTFAFLITPGLMLEGLIFAVTMGFIGGLFPAVRAAHRPIAHALRGL